MRHFSMMKKFKIKLYYWTKTKKKKKIYLRSKFK